MGHVPLCYACIAPHGSEVIPSLGGRNAELFSKTRRGMRTLATEMAAARPDTVVVASPHNLRLLKHIGVVISQNSSGMVEDGGKRVKLSAKCDVGFGLKVIEEGEKLGLPVVGANYGALEGPLSDLAMDWGTLVPLWFFVRWRSNCRVLIVTPSRGIPLKQNFEFGRAVARVAEASKKRVAFVASSDQAHAHRKDGPYGYSPRAKEYDQRVLAAVDSNELASLLTMDKALIDEAKPDSLWQMMMLAGALEAVPLSGKLISYEVPTYFGMLCASFKRPKQDVRS